MPGGPVSGACGRCKARHIKCDESRPSCARCTRTGAICPGYVKERKFLDEGAGLRRKYGSHVSKIRATTNSKSARYYASTSDSLVDPRFRKEPEVINAGLSDKELNVPSTPGTYVEYMFNHSQLFTGIYGQTTSSAKAARHNDRSMNDDFLDQTGIRSSHEATPTPSIEAPILSLLPQQDATSSGDSSQLLSTSGSPSGLGHKHPGRYTRSKTADGTGDSLSYTVNSIFPESNERVSVQHDALDALDGLHEDDNHEIWFLLRHFSEVLGPWMDLYDLGNYFASYITSNAKENPLLRYAAAAIAAKQLGRVNGIKTAVGGVCSKQATMELYPHKEEVDWFYMGAKYYDKAIACLREAFIPDDPGENSASVLRSSDDNGKIQTTLGTSKRWRLSGSRFSRTRTDRLLAATSILSVYEFLDGSNIEWSRHLNGVKSLLDEAEVVFMPRAPHPGLPFSSHEPVVAPSRAQVASFWNFARCDYLASYIHREPTRLDTCDIPLWRAAGLLIDEDGFIIPTLIHKTYLCAPDEMREDMMSNALVWLISKVMNYLATDWKTAGSPASVDQEHANKWRSLQKELDVWHKGLCESFRPSCRLECEPEASDPARALFPEMFFSIPMCGASIQHYHFARIILLLYKPHEEFEAGISVRNRIQRYRDISKKIDYHSREICGVALGRPPEFVRIHMLQPLFIAGQCLEKTEEREVVLDLIRSIETDTGWATEYRAKELISEWGWQSDSSPNLEQP